MLHFQTCTKTNGWNPLHTKTCDDFLMLFFLKSCCYSSWKTSMSVSATRSGSVIFLTSFQLVSWKHLSKPDTSAQPHGNENCTHVNINYSKESKLQSLLMSCTCEIKYAWHYANARRIIWRVLAQLSKVIREILHSCVGYNRMLYVCCKNKINCFMSRMLKYRVSLPLQTGRE